MNIDTLSLKITDSDHSNADWLLPILLNQLRLTAEAGELKFIIPDNGENWNSNRQDGFLHHFNDELFFQLQGGCEFEFANHHKIQLLPSMVLLVPRGTNHFERCYNFDQKSFANVVLISSDDKVQIHLAVCGKNGNHPDIYRQWPLNNPALYQALLNALFKSKQEQLAKLLLKALLWQLEFDAANAVKNFSAPYVNLLARRAKELIENKAPEELKNVADLALLLGCSKNYLSTLFHQSYGIKLKEFMLWTRLDNAKRMLLSGKMNTSEVAMQCGFLDASYFSRIFRKRFGCRPSEMHRVLPE